VSANDRRKILHEPGIVPPARVPACRGGRSYGSRTEPARGRLLQRRGDLASAPLCSLPDRTGSRRLHLAGSSANPTGASVTQQARQFAWTLGQQPARLRYLIRDRDSKFTRSFDVVFASAGIEIVKTPVRAPKANAIAERFVGPARRECLDWLVVVNGRQLEYVHRVFAAHYNRHRPHRSLNLAPPPAIGRERPLRSLRDLQRRDRLGGLIHEYSCAA
jgi:putative transposase